MNIFSPITNQVNNANICIDDLKASISEMEATLLRKEILEPYRDRIHQLPSGKWHIDIYDDNGKRNNVTRDSLEKLENYIIKHYSTANVQTIVKLFPKFMEYRKITVSLATCQDDERYFRFYIKSSALGNMPLQDIRNRHIYDFLNHVKSVKAKSNKPDLHYKYWKNVMITINGFLNWAVANDYLEFYPIKGDLQFNQDFFVPAIQHEDCDQTYSDTEKSLIFDLARKDFEGAKHNTACLGVILAFYTGIRVGELIAQKWCDLDFEKGLIHLRRERVKTGEVKEHCKSKAGDRYIQLGQKSIDLYKLIYDTNVSKGFGVSGDDFIFLRFYMGKVDLMTARCLDQLLRKYCKQLNIVAKSMHDIRRTFCTNLYSTDIPDKELQRVMGHASFLTTLSYVKHQACENTRDYIALLEE